MFTTIRRLVLLAALAWTGTPLPGFAAAQATRVTAVTIESDYQIDGQLSESFWEQLEWHDSFRSLKSDEPAPEQTRFAVAVTSDTLLVGIVAEVDGEAVVAGSSQPPAGTAALVGYGKEPGIELFIAPTAHGDQYGQWYCTTKGLANDIWRTGGTGSGGLAAWRSQADVVSRVAEGRWILEMAIPLAALKLEAPSQSGEWRMMVGRVHPKNAERPVAYSSNAPLSDNFHELANYVPLIIERSVVEDFLWSLRLANEGEIVQDASGALVYRVEVEADRLSEGGPAWRTVQIDGALDTGRGVIAATNVIALASNKPAAVGLSFTLPQGEPPAQGMLRLALSAKENPGRPLAVHAQDVPMNYAPVAVRLTQPAYRNSIYATEQIDAIEARVTLAIDPNALHDARLVAALYADGDAVEPIVSEERAITSSRVTVRLDLKRKLEVGAYRLNVKVRQPNGKAWETNVALHSLAPSPNEWRIDANKVLRRNGEPVLPYGWFGWKDSGDPATAGINTVFVYHLPNQGIEKTLAWMDRMASEGVFCLVSPWPASMYRKNQKRPLSVAEEEQLRRYVRRLRDHQALMAYYMYDEPEYVPVSPKRLERAYEILQEEDPYHSCVILNMQFDAIAQYADCADVIMPDPYPSFRENIGPISGIGKVAKHLNEAARVADGRRAVWLTAQAFAWDAQTPAARAPNFLELRNQQVQGIVCGAKGYLWWVYGRQLNDKNLELGIPFLAREARLLKDAILAPEGDVKLRIEAADALHLHAAVRQVGEHVFIFVVNTSLEPQGDVTFDLPSLDTGSLQVVSEARSLQVNDGSWRDSFAAYAAHIYTTDPDYAFGQTVSAVQRRIDEALEALDKPGNLAFRGKGATIETSPFIQWGAFPKRLNDGYVGRAWLAKQGKDPAWVQVNFTRTAKVGRVVAFTNATSYEVQVKDGPAWSTVASGRKPADTPLVATFEPVTTDAIRLVIHAAGANASDTITLQEIEAYSE